MTSIPDLSIIIPVKDEDANIAPMVEEIVSASADWPWKFEIVFVDDGSTDRTWERIREARESLDAVRAVRFERNFGQTAAIQAGTRHARAPVCVTLDGDCQNDPADIAKLMEAKQRADIVMGWRKHRADNAWRHIQSRVANGFRNALTSESVHDIGCAIKAYDREKMLALPLFEGMHRFFPTLFRYRGWTVAEVEVNHRPRTRGQTKYGMWNRVFRALRDLFAVRWMRWRMIDARLRDEDTID